MLDDTNLLDVDAGWYRDQMGVVSQDPRLFSETISENIAYGKEGLTQASHPPSFRKDGLTTTNSMAGGRVLPGLRLTLQT